MKVPAALLLLCCLPSICHADWPQFRGPESLATATDAKAAELSWKSLQWKAELPGRGASSPIVWDDHVFVTAFSGYGLTAEEPGRKEDLRLHVIAIDGTSGKTRWDRSMAANAATQDATPRVVDHGFASSTPCTDGSAVYAYFGVSGVVAYDFAGNQLWHTQVGSKTAGFGSASSPVVWGDLVFVNASIESERLLALDKQTGDVVWEVDGIVRSWSTPVVARTAAGDEELIINHKNLLRGLDPATGKPLWTCEGIDDYVVPVPVFHDGTLYCLGGRSNRCLAVKLGGRGDVTDSHLLWRVNLGANVTSPVYFDGHLYWASDKGLACCLSAEDGSLTYRKRLPTRSRLYASIVRVGSELLVVTRDQGLLVLPAEPEYEVLHALSFTEEDGLLSAAPAIAAGRILIRTDAHLYCFETGVAVAD